MDKLQTRGGRIKYLRQRVLGIGPDEFANLIGVSRGAVSNWERTKVECGISLKHAKTLAELTGATVEWITSGQGEPGAVPLPSDERSGMAIADNSSTGSFRNQALRDIPDRQIAQEAIVAGVETAFLVMLNRAPTAAEMALLVRSSTELFEARRVLARYRNQVTNGRIPTIVRDRKDETTTEPV